MVATETSLPAATLGHLALAEKQYLGLTFLQVLLMLVDMYMLVYEHGDNYIANFLLRSQPRTSVFQVRKEPALRAVYQVNLLKLLLLVYAGKSHII